MLEAIVTEIRGLLQELEVRPPASGARPGMASQSTATRPGSVARRMQRPPTPRAMVDAQRKARQLQQAARQTAQRQQQAAAQTRRTLAKPSATPSAPSATT